MHNLLKFLLFIWVHHCVSSNSRQKNGNGPSQIGVNMRRNQNQTWHTRIWTTKEPFNSKWAKERKQVRER